jgi:hypothetical protein
VASKELNVYKVVERAGKMIESDSDGYQRHIFTPMLFHISIALK